VAILENAGYRRLDDILDLEREDFIKLAGIMKDDADKLMAIIEELTTDAPDEEAPTAAGSVAGSTEEAAGTDAAAEAGVEAEPPAAT
jgi:N utilization substance protein A